MTKDERLWSKHDVAEYLGVDVRTVTRLRIPRVAMPGRGKKPIVRFDPSQVKAWVESNKTRKAG